MSDRQTQREPSAARANLEERTTAVARPPSTTTSPSFPAFANPTLVQQTLSSPPATYLPTPLHSSLDQLRCSPPSPSLLRSRSPLVSARSPPRPPVPFHAKSLTSDSPSPSLLSSSQLCSLLTARDRTLSPPETSATQSVSVLVQSPRSLGLPSRARTSSALAPAFPSRHPLASLLSFCPTWYPSQRCYLVVFGGWHSPAKRGGGKGRAARSLVPSAVAPSLPLARGGSKTEIRQRGMSRRRPLAQHVSCSLLIRGLSGQICSVSAERLTRHRGRTTRSAR